MKLLNFLTTTFVFAGVSFSVPTSDGAVEPITGDIVSTGTTEEGLPFTITTGTRTVTDAEIAEWNAQDFSNGTEVGLAKRSGEGATLNCNQWYSSKYCYCNGAMSNRGDSYWGSQDHCAAHAVDRGGTGIYGNSESYTIKWLPTVKIEYKITNFCGWTYTVKMDDCGAKFLDLIDWCQWTWNGAKGGMFRLNDCVQYYFDVNSR